jgi:hypothetical protein
LSTFTSRYTSSVLAMKLNMIVVITMWLPRYACRYAGTAAHAAPNAAAATIISGNTIAAGIWSPIQRATRPTPRPPSKACPSAPMLKSPPCAATATASPVKMNVVV